MSNHDYLLALASLKETIFSPAAFRMSSATSLKLRIATSGHLVTLWTILRGAFGVSFGLKARDNSNVDLLVIELHKS